MIPTTRLRSRILVAASLGFVFILLLQMFSPLLTLAQTVQPPKSIQQPQIVIPTPGGTKVNTWNGNMFFSLPLLGLSGRGIPISLSLNYNSSWDKNVSNYGYGWQFSYNIYYITNSNGDFIVTWQDGRSETFSNSSGTYVPSADTFDSLTQYQTGKYDLRTKEGIDYFFDDATGKKISRVQDQYGNVDSFTYSSANLLSTITDPSGRVLTLNYTSSNLTQIVDANVTPNRIENIQYDANGNLGQITDLNGNPTVLIYNSDHQLITITDPLKTITTLTYANGVAVSIVSNAGPGTYLSYDSTNLVTKVIQSSNDSNLYVTNYYYDSQGRISKIEKILDASGNKVSQYYTWDNNNDLLTATDENGKTLAYTYDSKGNILTTIDAAGNVTTYTYDPTFNKVTSVKNALNQTTTYQYDSKGNMLKSIDPLNNVTNYTYAANGDLLTNVNPNGKTTTYSYNSNGYQTQSSDPLSNSTINTYDAIGHLTSSKDANGNTATYTYDINGNKTSMTDPLVHVTSYVYDSNSNLLKSTDANGLVKTYTYDGLNRLVKESDNDVNSTTYLYDSLGNLQSTTDAKGNMTKYFYDNLGRLTKERDELGMVTTYSYDAVGNLLTKTDPNGNITKYSYDSLNRVTLIDYPDNNDTTFTYDALGNVLTESNPNSTITNSYNALNQLVSERTQTGSIVKTISYSYDAAGNKVTMTDGEGGVTTYAYDDASRLTSEKNPKAQITSYAYDAANRITQETLGNGTIESYSYDNGNELTSLVTKNSSGSQLSTITYVYDSVGNRKSMTDGTGTTSYTYDNEYRLTKAAYPNGTSDNYSYDSVGNRIQLTNAATTNYSYNADNQLQIGGTKNYAYDNNGNLVGTTVGSVATQYTYDSKNQLTKVALSDGTSDTYSYYPDGRRLSQTDKTGKATYFIYDGNNILEETDANGVLNTRYTSGATDQWISEDQGTNSYYYTSDALGSVNAVYNSSQTAVNTYKYDPFGNITSQTGTVANRFTYTGRELDSDTGLYYYRARYYDATTGRFVEQDPVNNVNLYKYANDNPIVFGDPSGRYMQPTSISDVLLNGNTASLIKTSVNVVSNEAIGLLVAYDPSPFGMVQIALDRSSYDQTNEYFLNGKHAGTVTSIISDVIKPAKGESDLLKILNISKSVYDARESFAAFKAPTQELIKEVSGLANSFMDGWNGFINQTKGSGNNIVNSLLGMLPHVQQAYAAELSPSEMADMMNSAIGGNNGSRNGKFAVSVTKEGQEQLEFIAPNGQVTIIPTQGSNQIPTQPTVMLYAHSNYQNQVGQSYSAGEFSNDPSRNSYSLAIPAGFSVETWRGDNKTGTYACWSQSVPNLQDYSDWENNIDSIEVHSSNVCPDTSSWVKICTNTGQTGCSNITDSIPSLGNAGFGNDTLKSIYLSPNGNYQVTLFEDDNFQGRHQLITGSNNDLGGIPFGYGTSSLEVRQKNPAYFTLYSLGNLNGEAFSSDRSLSDLSAWNWNDKGESITVANGYEVVACTDPNFGGVCGRTASNHNDINEVANGLKDGISSIEVCQGSCPSGSVTPKTISPANGAVYSPGSVIPFNWQGNGDIYTVKVSGGGLTSDLYSGDVNLITHWEASGLQSSANPYTWTMYAHNPYGPSGWTTPQVFYIQDVAPASATILGNNSVVLNNDLALNVIGLSPQDASNVTYNWSPTPKSGQGTNSAIYNWTTLGTKTVNLSLSNTGGNLQLSKSINVFCAQGQYQGDYYSNNSLTGSPISSECDSAINFNWGISGPVGVPANIFGNGQDGSLRLTTSIVDSPIDSVAQGTINTSTLNATNSSFAAGQKVLIHQTRGTNAGTYQINDIASYSAGVITLKQPLNITYVSDGGANAAQVLVIKQYTDVTIPAGIIWTAKPWNGSTGGILYFYANGTTTVNGQINANGAQGISGTGIDVTPNGGGFRGGRGISGGQSGNNAYQGEGTIGLGTSSTTPEGNGGGAGTIDDHQGGGGGNATAGLTGTGGGNGGGGDGNGGLAVGDPNLNSLLFGGGGGGGTEWDGSARNSSGSNGGGIIGMNSNNIIVGSSSSIIANGGNYAYDGEDGKGMGSAGAGGSIKLVANIAKLGSSLINAVGGTGAGFIPVNAGSNGRIALQYCNSYTGQSTPSASTTQINCAVDNFSARWTGNMNITTAGNYVFTTQADDGIRVWIDGQLQIDRWSGAYTTVNTPVTLTEGNHAIKAEYFEATGTANVSISWVQVVNNPPVVIQIPAQTITQGQTFATINLANYGSDPDVGDAITWSYSGNTNIEVAIANNIATLTYPNTWIGAENVTFKATDKSGATASSTAAFTVNASTPVKTELLSAPWHLTGNNGASELYQTIPQTILAGKTTLEITYDLHGLMALGGDASAIIFDQNGWQYVSLSNYGTNGKNGSQMVDIPLSAFTGLNLTTGSTTIHTRFWYGSSFTVDITSIKVFSSTGTSSTNNPPTFTSMPVTSVNENSAYSYQVSATDPESNTLTYSLVQGKTGMTINSSTGLISWTPTYNDSGTYTIIVGVSDGTNPVVQQSYSLVVNNVNRAPVVTQIPGQTINKGQSFATINLASYGSDPDSDLITWSYSGNTNISVSIASNIATLTYPNTWTGSENITFKATDNQSASGTSTSTFLVNVPVNNLPVVNQIPGQTITQGQNFSVINLASFGSDPDSGDSITWSYSGNTNIAVSIASNIATLTYSNTWVGTESITFKATDIHAASASSTAAFVVNLPGGCTSNQFYGQYFNNKTLSGTPTLTRCDNAVNFDWGGGSPDPSIPADNFSARWTGSISVAATGNYTFTMQTDDGDRLYVDGNLIINNFVDHGTSNDVATIVLNPGTHSIKMEYYEAGGGAVAKLFIATPCTPGINAFCVDYFNNTALSGQSSYRTTEASINHDWGSGGPGNGIGNDNFSGRWTGNFTFTAGNHTFTTSADDGVRLYVDGTLVIDNWLDQGTTVKSVTLNLTAGSHLIREEYYEHTGGAVNKLSWN